MTTGDGSLWGYFLFIGLQSGRYTSFMITVVDRLREFMKNEARSCSMDFRCVNAVYVYRMWGGDRGDDEALHGCGQIRQSGRTPLRPGLSAW